jgi:hypothetical protein
MGRVTIGPLRTRRPELLWSSLFSTNSPSKDSVYCTMTGLLAMKVARISRSAEPGTLDQHELVGNNNLRHDRSLIRPTGSVPGHGRRPPLACY